MEMEFFDVNAFIGRPVNSVYKPALTAADMIAEMDKQKIRKALVWHVFQYEGSPVQGNRMITERRTFIRLLDYSTASNR